MNDIPQNIPEYLSMTPEEMALYLEQSGMSEDDALELFQFIGNTYGWTPKLNEAGKLYLYSQMRSHERRTA